MLRNHEIDFAGTDAPLSEDELRSMRSKVLHVPTVVGGVMPIYHIDGVLEELRFTPQVLAGIYAGKIQR